VITGTAVSFGYRDNGAELRASQPLIQLSPRPDPGHPVQ
jgi:hypothetical protein